MPRTKFLDDAIRVCLTLEAPLKRAAAKKAKAYGFAGGLSEYVSRMLVLDHAKESQLAKDAPRSLRHRSKVSDQAA